MSEAQERGREAEERVRREMEHRGYQLVKQRWRTPAAEIDLLMASPSEYLVIEVKTLSDRGAIFAANRVSPAQKRRLARAVGFVQSLAQKDVRLVFAFVRPDGQILLFNPGLGDLSS